MALLEILAVEILLAACYIYIYILIESGGQHNFAGGLQTRRDLLLYVHISSKLSCSFQICCMIIMMMFE